MPAGKKVIIASDHAGLSLKTELQKLLPSVIWEDLGPESQSSERTDFPDAAEKVALRISKDPSALGILICGTGIGMSISANKFPGIRAALVENPISARLSREHNNANILCLGGRFLAPEYASEIVKTWLTTPFSQEPRYQQRIDKIHSKENSKEKP